jgi:hypothetical protein
VPGVDRGRRRCAAASVARAHAANVAGEQAGRMPDGTTMWMCGRR